MSKGQNSKKNNLDGKETIVTITIDSFKGVEVKVPYEKHMERKEEQKGHSSEKGDEDDKGLDKITKWLNERRGLLQLIAVIIAVLSLMLSC